MFTQTLLSIYSILVYISILHYFEILWTCMITMILNVCLFGTPFVIRNQHLAETVFLQVVPQSHQIWVEHRHSWIVLTSGCQLAFQGVTQSLSLTEYDDIGPMNWMVEWCWMQTTITSHLWVHSHSILGSRSGWSTHLRWRLGIYREAEQAEGGRMGQGLCWRTGLSTRGTSGYQWQCKSEQIYLPVSLNVAGC